MKKPERAPVLLLSNNSKKSIEMVAGALALSALGYQEQSALRTRAEQIIAALRSMGGSRQRRREGR